MHAPIAILAAALALAAPAAAQTATDDRFGDEDRQDTRLGLEAWNSRFVGQYAVDGACEDPEAVWTLTEGTVRAGRLNCLGMGKLTWEDDALLVPLSSCTRMGGDLPDRTLGFRKEGHDVVVTGTDASRDVRLTPCR